MLIDLCPVCGSDVSHFYDAAGNILLNENGVSLYACETPWLHETPAPAAQSDD